MEDSVDALKMAFSVFAFILALAIVFAMFSQAREVSDIVIDRTDRNYFTEYALADEEKVSGREVGIETIIPTLYRYYKEKFSVDIKTSGDILERFDEETERLVYTRGDNYEDYKDLYPNRISWLANPNIDTQKRVSSYIEGEANDINGTKLTKYNSENLEKYRNRTFIETFEQKNNGEEMYKGEDGSVVYLIQGTTKLHVNYTLK